MAAIGFAWRWWAYVCGASVVLVACLVAMAMSRERARDREFVQAELLPLAQFVTSFRDANGRLPTGAEFKEWAGKNRPARQMEYYPQKPGFVSDWGTPGRDFLVGAWRGQWMLYYQSWNGKDLAGEMPSIMHSPAHG